VVHGYHRRPSRRLLRALGFVSRQLKRGSRHSGQSKTPQVAGPNQGRTFLSAISKKPRAGKTGMPVLFLGASFTACRGESVFFPTVPVVARHAPATRWRCLQHLRNRFPRGNTASGATHRLTSGDASGISETGSRKGNTRSCSRAKTPPVQAAHSTVPGGNPAGSRCVPQRGTTGNHAIKAMHPGRRCKSPP
jgi:hypothetical protein